MTYFFVDSDEENILGLHANSEEEQIHYADSILLYPESCVTVGALMILLAFFTTKYNLVGDARHQLFNITAFSLPLVDTICVPYKQWMKKESIILASLWFGSQKSSMGTFLKLLQKTMKELYQGIKCQSPEKDLS